jgi:uncharacterized membrane protein YdjX (TVP38/TMEM64 family)
MEGKTNTRQTTAAAQSIAISQTALVRPVDREAVKAVCQNMEDRFERKVGMIEDRIEEKIEARKERRRERKSLEGTMKWVMNISTVLGLAVMGWFAWYCYRQGIFQSQDALEGFLHGFGFWAPVIFTLVQGIQVVLPILPGAIGCLAGVLVFGPVWGFIYNYIGICVGSLCAFLLARRFGAPFVRSISNPKTYEKYIGWLEKGNRFDRFFALAIFLPVAPDDFLCYLAGLTRMSFKKMTLIILLGKPASIALYSLGLYTIGLKALSLLQ